MDERDAREPGVNSALERSGAGGAHRDSEQVRADIEATRAHLGGLLGELARRRREAFDARLQLRRHPLAFAAGAVLLVGAVGGLGALAVSRRRQRRRRPGAALLPRLRRLWREADLGLAGTAAERTGPRPSGVSARIITAGARLAAALLIRRLGALVASRRHRTT